MWKLSRCLLVVLLIASVGVLPCYAALPGGLQPVEPELLKEKKLDDELKQEEPAPKPIAKAKVEEGSTWYWWALAGVAVLGGIALAAGSSGGSSGGGGGGGGNPTGAVRVSW